MSKKVNSVFTAFLKFVGMVEKGGQKMRRFLLFFVLVGSFLSVLLLFPSNSWCQGQGEPTSKFHPCSDCKDACAKVIRAMPETLECAASAAAFGGICAVLIGESGVGAILCAAGATGVDVVCSKYGWPWIKNNPDEAAKIICKEIKLCL